MASGLPIPLAMEVPQDPTSDDLLVERFADGDRSAFDQIVANHYARVARLVYRLLGWDDDVADVIQEVFLSALEKLPTFRRQAKFTTWLMTITINTCRKHLRRRFLRSRLAALAGRSRVSGSAVPADQHAASRETFERLRAAVHRLPNRYREVIVLRYLQELPVGQISGVLGISHNAVEVRLTRARRRLARALPDLAEDSS